MSNMVFEGYATTNVTPRFLTQLKKFRVGNTKFSEAVNFRVQVLSAKPNKMSLCPLKNIQSSKVRIRLSID